MSKHIEWLNLNELRSYPIHEGTERVPFIDPEFTISSGTVLDDNIMVDFKAVMTGNSRIQLYIHKVVIADSTVSIDVYGFTPSTNVISVSLLQRLYDTGGIEVFPVFSGTGNRSSSEYTVIDMVPSNEWTTSTCRVVLGRHTDTDIPDGIYYFKPYQSLIEPCLVEAGPDAVTRLIVTDGSGSEVALTGDVTFTAGSNMVIGGITSTNTIRFNAIPGQGYIDGCEEEANVVRSINGIPLKDVIIVGDGRCTNVTTQGNTITISDTCSTPCCGCDELEMVVNQLREIQQRYEDIEDFAEDINSVLNTLTDAMARLPSK